MRNNTYVITLLLISGFGQLSLNAQQHKPFGEIRKSDKNSALNMHLLPEGEFAVGKDQWGSIVRVNMLKIKDWSKVPGVKKAWSMQGFEGEEGMAFHPIISEVKDVDGMFSVWNGKGKRLYAISFLPSPSQRTWSDKHNGGSWNDEDRAIRRAVYVTAEDAGDVEHIHLQNLEIRDVRGMYRFAGKETNGGIICQVTGKSKKTRFVDLRIEGCTFRTKSIDRYPVVVTSSWRKEPACEVVWQNNTLDHAGRAHIVMPADQWPRKLVYYFDPEVRKVFPLEKTAAPISPFTGRVGCEDIFSEMAARLKRSWSFFEATRAEEGRWLFKYQLFISHLVLDLPIMRGSAVYNWQQNPIITRGKGGVIKRNKVTYTTPFHYDWHWFWETGNGDIGNSDVHRADLVRFGLGVTKLPRATMCYGGRVGYADSAQTPNTQVAVHDYGDVTFVQEVRGLPTPKFRKHGIAIFTGSEGYVGMIAGGSAYFDPSGKLIQKFSGKTDDHFGNFIEAVHSRDREHLNAEIIGGHLAAGLCHLGNISYRLGQQAAPQEILEQLASHKLLDESDDTFERTRKHLADNGVDIEKTRLTVGPWLQFDPEKEQFIGNTAADAMLTREYRQPFVVPTASEV